MKTYIDNCTNTYRIDGERYEVTAPARFECGTDRLIDDELDESAVSKSTGNVS